MKRESKSSVLEIVLSSESADDGSKYGVASKGERPRSEGVAIASLAGFDESGAPLVSVSLSGSEKLVKALSIVALDRRSIGRSAVIQFEGFDPEKPIIMGLVHHPLDPGTLAVTRTDGLQKVVNVETDGERLLITADKEIVLRCGKSSITLTRAGKVLIRGEYLLSRSSGVNRIKGGSVQIN